MCVGGGGIVVISHSVCVCVEGGGAYCGDFPLCVWGWVGWGVVILVISNSVCVGVIVVIFHSVWLRYCGDFPLCVCVCVCWGGGHYCGDFPLRVCVWGVGGGREGALLW